MLYMPTNETSFNTGMELLLDTVGSFCDYIKKKFGLIEGKSKDHEFYPIEKGKINKQSIKFSADIMEQWTRACKFLLIQLQRINIVIKMKDEAEQLGSFKADPSYCFTKMPPSIIQSSYN